MLDPQWLLENTNMTVLLPNSLSSVYLTLSSQAYTDRRRPLSISSLATDQDHYANKHVATPLNYFLPLKFPLLLGSSKIQRAMVAVPPFTLWICPMALPHIHALTLLVDRITDSLIWITSQCYVCLCVLLRLMATVGGGQYKQRASYL